MQPIIIKERKTHVMLSLLPSVAGEMADMAAFLGTSRSDFLEYTYKFWCSCNPEIVERARNLQHPERGVSSNERRY